MANFGVLLLVLFFSAVALATPWSLGGSNDPKSFSPNYVYSLKTLLAKSSDRVTDPWSDTYWPSYLSGIAHRWNSATPNDFKYKTLSLAQLKNASAATLKQLSPAEKLDILSARYDYPTVRSEWQRTSPQDATWEGLCHGWAPASLFYKQPNPVNLPNPDGVIVPFGSSDVKALLTYFVGNYEEAFSTSTYLGERCNYDLDQNPNLGSRPSCADLNAGSFFVQLVNQVSNLKQGFVADRERSIQVWNQPVFGYQISNVQNNRTSANFTLTFLFGQETQPSWNSHAAAITPQPLSISVQLDASGNVIGGDYNQYIRPDFSWQIQIADFNGYFKILKSLYSASVGGGGGGGLEFAASHVSPSQRIGHVEISEASGSVEVGPYQGHVRKSWTFHPVQANGGVHLTFKNVDTERQFDLIRVYELGQNDELGALIRVIHGKTDSVSVSVNGSVYVSFVSAPQTIGGQGFQMNFSRF